MPAPYIGGQKDEMQDGDAEVNSIVYLGPLLTNAWGCRITSYIPVTQSNASHADHSLILTCAHNLYSSIFPKTLLSGFGYAVLIRPTILMMHIYAHGCPGQ